MENLENLKGKKVLVTGGTGLVGSHIVELLCTKQAHVIVTSRSQDPNSYFFSKKLDACVTRTDCDVASRRRVFDIITKYEIEYVFHLAAQPIVPVAYHNPYETFLTNIMGTVHVLEALRTYPGVKGVVVASSDKAYGKSDKPYTENHPLAGDHPYEASKSSADLVAQSYIRTYDRMPVVIARFGNIYGPGDLNFSRIIPGMMQSVLTKTPLDIRSNGHMKRDYVYVKDVAIGYLFLLTHLQKTQGQVYNLSSDENYSVLELIKKVQRILKRKIRYTIRNSAKNEIPYQHLDYSKIKELGWKPRYTLRRALPETFTWYKKYFASQG